MYLKFDEHGLFGFGDFASFSLHSNLAKFPFRPMDYSPWSSKNLIDRNRLNKPYMVKRRPKIVLGPV